MRPIRIPCPWRAPGRVPAPAAALFLPVFLLFTAAGCARNIHYWGDYEESLYAVHFKNDPERAFALLSGTVSYAERKNLTLAPGVCAEYGFLLYQRGDPAGAAAYFRKEAEAYPESAMLMSALIERLKRPGGRDGSRASSPQAPESAATGAGGRGEE